MCFFLSVKTLQCTVFSYGFPIENHWKPTCLRTFSSHGHPAIGQASLRGELHFDLRIFLSKLLRDDGWSWLELPWEPSMCAGKTFRSRATFSPWANPVAETSLSWKIALISMLYMLAISIFHIVNQSRRATAETPKYIYDMKLWKSLLLREKERKSPNVLRSSQLPRQESW